MLDAVFFAPSDITAFGKIDVKNIDAELFPLGIAYIASLDMIRRGGLDKIGCKAMNIAIALKPDGSLVFPCGDFPKKTFKGNLKKIYFSKEAEKQREMQGKYWFCKNCYIRCMGFPSMLLNPKCMLSIAKSYKTF